jgi:predicted DCC family thiol-disulfide oxidoreductase YuxK
MRFLGTLSKTLGFDYRSMALYRALMGIIVMADVVYRLPDLTNFYTDLGLVPRTIFLSEMAMPWSFSLHLANGSLGFAIFMFAIHFIFGLMIFTGTKTRWAFLGAYIMTVSVHNRDWMVNNGGDDILRSILFLSIFLPTNRWWSVDSALSKEERPAGSWMSFWVIAFTLQVFVIYFVSYLLKDHPVWRKDFTAVYYASRLDIFATPLGLWLRNFPLFWKASTAYTIIVEWLGPILLVIPFLFGRFWWQVKVFTVLIFWGLHAGIIATMYIGVFPYTCLVIWLIFLPGPFWDKVLGHFRKKNFGKLSIYFDADCGFCKKAVYLIREFFLLHEVPILEGQSDPSIMKDMEKNTSWVIVNERNERFYRYEAFLEILRHSPSSFFKLFFYGSMPVKFIGQKVYHWVSHHRETMGKFSQWLLWKEPKKSFRALIGLRELFGLFIFLTLLNWNLTTIKKLHYSSPFFESATRWLHLYQEWNMFAPFPKMDNAWLEVVAELGDGTAMEILSGDTDIYRVKDQDFARDVPNEHWRKFFLNATSRTDYMRYYGGFLCRLWNTRKIRKKDTTLRKMEIISYSQMNLPNGDRGGIERKLTWKHWCFDEDYKREANNPATNWPDSTAPSAQPVER